MNLIFQLKSHLGALRKLRIWWGQGSGCVLQSDTMGTVLLLCNRDSVVDDLQWQSHHLLDDCVDTTIHRITSSYSSSMYTPHNPPLNSPSRNAPCCTLHLIIIIRHPWKHLPTIIVISRVTTLYWIGGWVIICILWIRSLFFVFCCTTSTANESTISTV